MELMSSARGKAADDADTGGGDLMVFAFVKLRNTVASPLGRLDSGTEESSSGRRDMCSSARVTVRWRVRLGKLGGYC